jgi:ABC-type lipoprotein export system ATPase subunit
MTSPTIQCRNVSKRFGDGQAVFSGVDLEVYEGDFISISGRSGSGKSTLLNIIAGLTRPTEGTVLFRGVSLSTMHLAQAADYRRRNIGFIFQLYHLIPILTALENVAIPLLPYAPPKRNEERARVLLEQVGLGDRHKALPHELSGGEQQRVAIARALIAEPSMILADEPTGNLDAKTARGVFEVLRERTAASGISLVLITHDTELAANAARRFRLEAGCLKAAE